MEQLCSHFHLREHWCCCLKRGFFLQGRKSGGYFFQIGNSSENKSCLFLHPLHKKHNKKISTPTSTSNRLPSGSCLTMTLTETSTSNRLPSGAIGLGPYRVWP